MQIGAPSHRTDQQNKEGLRYFFELISPDQHASLVAERAYLRRLRDEDPMAILDELDSGRFVEFSSPQRTAVRVRNAALLSLCIEFVWPAVKEGRECRGRVTEVLKSPTENPFRSIFEDMVGNISRTLSHQTQASCDSYFYRSAQMSLVRKKDSATVEEAIERGLKIGLDVILQLIQVLMKKFASLPLDQKNEEKLKSSIQPNNLYPLLSVWAAGGVSQVNALESMIADDSDFGYDERYFELISDPDAYRLILNKAKMAHIEQRITDVEAFAVARGMGIRMGCPALAAKVEGRTVIWDLLTWACEEVQEKILSKRKI